MRKRSTVKNSVAGSGTTIATNKELQEVLWKLDSNRNIDPIMKSLKKRKHSIIVRPLVLIGCLMLGLSIYLIAKQVNVINAKHLADVYWTNLQKESIVTGVLFQEGIASIQYIQEPDVSNDNLVKVRATSESVLRENIPLEPSTMLHILNATNFHRKLTNTSPDEEAVFYFQQAQELSIGIISSSLEPFDQWKVALEIKHRQTVAVTLNFLTMPAIVFCEFNQSTDGMNFLNFWNALQMSLNLSLVRAQHDVTKIIIKSALGQLDWMRTEMTENSSLCSTAIRHASVLTKNLQTGTNNMISDATFDCDLALVVACLLLVWTIFNCCLAIMGFSYFGIKFKGILELKEQICRKENLTFTKKECQEIFTAYINRRVLPEKVRMTATFKADGELEVGPVRLNDVTCLLCSISNFRKVSNCFSPSVTIEILTIVMSLLEERASNYKVFVLKRVPDGLVLMSDNIGDSREMHACEVANVALDFMACCSDLEMGSGSNMKLQIQIGIHTGHFTEMIYQRKGQIRYKLLGNNYTVLRKLHHTALPNRIVISDVTMGILARNHAYNFQRRGDISLKPVGIIGTYWLTGRMVSECVDSDKESLFGLGRSLIEMERKPLYRLDEDDICYIPMYDAHKDSVQSFNYKSSDESFVAVRRTTRVSDASFSSYSVGLYDF